jgi:hypothetical protein
MFLYQLLQLPFCAICFFSWCICSATHLLPQMDVLAGRTQQNSVYNIEGTVTVNVAPPDPLRFRQSTAYVTQQDYLPITETVRLQSVPSCPKPCFILVMHRPPCCCSRCKSSYGFPREPQLSVCKPVKTEQVSSYVVGSSVHVCTFCVPDAALQDAVLCDVVLGVASAVQTQGKKSAGLCGSFVPMLGSFVSGCVAVFLPYLLRSSWQQYRCC